LGLANLFKIKNCQDEDSSGFSGTKIPRKLIFAGGCKSRIYVVIPLQIPAFKQGLYIL
jgi:hypothetical protein